MNKLSITVAIPTFERPEWLKAAVKSCLSQTRVPDVILIGDDSSDSRTEEIIGSMAKESSAPIVYRHHKPSLKQAGNMNWLIESTTTSHFLLLHDDDLLLPEAIATLESIILKNPEIDGVFGNQSLIDESSRALPEDQSTQLNIDYGRNIDNEGLLANSLEVFITQMFPNDGYLIKTEIIKDIPWKPKEDVGDGCEYDFTLRLGQKMPLLYFVHQNLCLYRLNPSAMSRSKTADSGIHSYRILSHLNLESKMDDVKQRQLQRLSPVAIPQAIRNQCYKEAWTIYFSENHPWNFRLSMGGLKRLIRLFLCR
jgi:glycosyltransferase involved in cell wall biosynthesis